MLLLLPIHAAHVVPALYQEDDAEERLRIAVLHKCAVLPISSSVCT